MSAQMMGVPPCLRWGLAAPWADALLAHAVHGLLSVCRMDNGEACFILSSRNEVDRTAAVSQAQGTARLDIIHFSGRRDGGGRCTSPLPGTGGHWGAAGVRMWGWVLSSVPWAPTQAACPCTPQNLLP